MFSMDFKTQDKTHVSRTFKHTFLHQNPFYIFRFLSENVLQLLTFNPGSILLFRLPASTREHLEKSRKTMLTYKKRMFCDEPYKNTNWSIDPCDHN